MEINELMPTFASIMLIIVVSATTGGGIAAIGIIGVLNKIKEDPAFMKSVEKLGDSVPREHADVLAELARALAIGAEVVEEALDGIPASDKVVINDPEQVEITASDAAILTSGEILNQSLPGNDS